MPSSPQIPDSLSADLLSMAIVGPNEQLRESVAAALLGCQGGQIREFTTYPPSLDDVPKLLRKNFDVIAIDLDSDTEYALDLVECICINHSAIVMVYSAQTEPELLLRCMRAGAREFLTLPLTHNAVAEALVRASAHRPILRPEKDSEGKTLVFMGAKGGCGVTTLACNFAVSLAKECSQNTLLIDLDLPLGDVALTLNISSPYSTNSVLENFCRLDANLLSTMLSQHSSGLSVLAAPGELLSGQVSNEAIDRVLEVARQEFDYVVIDAGARSDLERTDLFSKCSSIYLVTQIGISELRNANRLITRYASLGSPKIEVVINRYESSSLGIDEEHIQRALTQPAQWKIPENPAVVRQARFSSTPFALENSTIARAVRQMAKSACGKSDQPEKKRTFSFFR
jgi:pilus assembly protein CpaE